MNAIEDLQGQYADQIDPISSNRLAPDPINEEERKRLLSEMGKLAARARRQYRVECVECGKSLVGLSRRKFCTPACQRRDWRRRLAAMSPGDPLPPPGSVG